jgi:hypothetical protein
MARFTYDPTRLNYTVSQTGKEYNLRLLQRAQAIFSTFLGLLPSNYVSTVQGPNYTNELKAVSVELAKLELAVEDINNDGSFEKTRSDFLYSIVGYLVLLNGRIPALEFSDAEFRSFLLAVIRIYFQGSVPASIRDAVALFIDGTVVVSENFLLVRQGASGLDVSDQFGFGVDVMCPGYFPPDIFDVDMALRQLLDVIRPAHTLYRIRYVFGDSYNPNSPFGKVLDAMRWHMADYKYDDFRSYWTGLRDRDRLGKKTNQAVTGEAHGDDF